ncbi:hypothetical protein GGR42_000270 [Saonia flava]|uniref:Anti-sigma K factor RskA C-terminal domain-containing protein n=1 Tax=Saonia flava TaxID=523696 RepID=A0A846QNW1_9FLAO|nr:anti-sigma factor [Saonia flava]NJB69808.1 hypothetical protein [Saonia flava]
MKNLLLFAGVLALLSSCHRGNVDDEPAMSNLTLNLNGLEDLGGDFLYEGWIIVDGAPVSTGTFSVNASGELSESTFSLDTEMLESATNFVLSIEPVPDPSPDPAPTKLLIGEFNGDMAAVSTGTVAASFDTVAGEYILATPTGTGAENEKYSGLWFLNNSSGSPMVGLELPTLNDGWKYEGWAVIDGVPVTTGTFTAVDDFDEADPFSGSNPGPPFPGEDFLHNAPSGLTFPTDLRGGVAVISIEPYPDNSPMPFTLKPLVGMIPADAMGVQALGDNVSASFPTGTVSR